MIYKRLFSLWLGILVPWTWADEVERHPNIVIILADDLGYGDLACYGSQQNRTPHIDQLAAEGLRFTDFHSNGPMCTPTRVALLTGLYQNRFGRRFETPLGGRAGHGEGLPEAAVTMAERLREQGYATGMFGKWHLGNEAPFLPSHQGFDAFRGLVTGDGDHHTQIDRSGGEDWWDGDRISMEEGYTAELITKHSVDFIEQHQEVPFFLFVPHLAIHFPWQGPEDPPHRRKGIDYKDDKWGIVRDRNNVAPHVKVMVEALDKSVGTIVAALKRLQLAEHTLVFFLSDNGGYRDYGDTHHRISDNGGLRGQKGDVFEGGHRVPAVAWWPGRIQPRPPETATVMTFDLLPTVLGLLEVEVDELGLDGVDIGPLLFGEADQRTLPSRDLYWRMGNEKAVRRGPWKLVFLPGRAPELFHLGDDPGEKRDLAGDEPDRVAALSRSLAIWEKSLE